MSVARPVLAALLLSVSASAFAQTQYSYGGPVFTAPQAPYTAGSRITGSFRVANPLAPNLTAVNIAAQVQSFSFTDGQATRTQTNSTVCDFSISTNAAGQITAHDIWLRELAPGATSHSLETRGPDSTDLAGFVTPAITGCGAAALNPFASVVTPIGTTPWTLLGPPAVTQIPVNHPFGLLGLIALIGVVGITRVARRDA